MTLFAALDYLSGKVISQVAPRHRHNEWLKFLKKLDSEIAGDLSIEICERCRLRQQNPPATPDNSAAFCGLMMLAHEGTKSYSETFELIHRREAVRASTFSVIGVNRSGRGNEIVLASQPITEDKTETLAMRDSFGPTVARLMSTHLLAS